MSGPKRVAMSRICPLVLGRPLSAMACTPCRPIESCVTTQVLSIGHVTHLVPPDGSVSCPHGVKDWGQGISR
jgi:hypothetical protein